MYVMYVCLCVCMYVCIYMYVYVCMYVCVCICIYMYRYVCICIWRDMLYIYMDMERYIIYGEICYMYGERSLGHQIKPNMATNGGLRYIGFSLPTWFYHVYVSSGGTRNFQNFWYGLKDTEWAWI